MERLTIERRLFFAYKIFSQGFTRGGGSALASWQIDATAAHHSREQHLP